MSDIDILRGYLIQSNNNIKFVIKIINNTKVITNVEIIFDYNTALLKLDGDKNRFIGTIPPYGKKHTAEFIMKPLCCIHDEEISATIIYRDSEWVKHTINMRPKNIHCIKPLLKHKPLTKAEYLDLSKSEYSVELGINFDNISIDSLTDFLLTSCKKELYKVDDFSFDEGNLIYFAGDALGDKAYYLLTAVVRKDEDVTQILLQAYSDKKYGLNRFLSEVEENLKHLVYSMSSARDIGIIKKEYISNIINSVMVSGHDNVVATEGSTATNIIKTNEMRKEENNQLETTPEIKNERQEESIQKTTVKSTLKSLFTKNESCEKDNQENNQSNEKTEQIKDGDITKTDDKLEDSSEHSMKSIVEEALALSGQEGDINSSASVHEDINAELEALVHELQPNIKVIGCGGSGLNSIIRMKDEAIKGVEIVALNTDAQHLLRAEADYRILIGRKTTKGLGSGGRPQIGEDAALESLYEINTIVADSDIVFIITGLGGGTGSGASPVIAKAAQGAGALTIAVVTLPFGVEGHVRRTNAAAGLEKLRDAVDTVIVFPNDKLLELMPRMPLQFAYNELDRILSRGIKAIIELITKPGIVNLGFSDVRTVMQNGGSAAISLGEADGENMAVESVNNAFLSPLLCRDISVVTSVLVHIVGGPDMTIAEVESAVEEVKSRIDHNAMLIFGAYINPELEHTMQTTIFFMG